MFCSLLQINSIKVNYLEFLDMIHRFPSLTICLFLDFNGHQCPLSPAPFGHFFLLIDLKYSRVHCLVTVTDVTPFTLSMYKDNKVIVIQRRNRTINQGL